MSSRRSTSRGSPDSGAAPGNDRREMAGPAAAAPPAPPDDPQELRQEIEQTREQLGDTVEELADRIDVKARAQDKAGQLSRRLRAQGVHAGNQAKAFASGTYGRLASNKAARQTVAPAVAASIVVVLAYLAARRRRARGPRAS
jgi:uncharacterized protein DUF3618